MGSLSRTAPTVAQFLGRLLLRPISFCQCSSSSRKCFFSRTPLPRGNSFFLLCSLSFLLGAPPPRPSPHRRRCLQAKFTAAPGLSLRRCRPGFGMAEARDRALFICKGRLKDPLRWLPLASTVLPSGLAHGLRAPCFVDVCQNSDRPCPPTCVWWWRGISLLMSADL